jgi:hypothetical protein
MLPRYIRLTDSILTGASLSPTTEAAGYPATNAAVEPVFDSWRTTDTSSQKLLIDLTAPARADLCAIVNHSLTETAVITVRGGSSQDPDGGEFETVIPWALRNAWQYFGLEIWQHWSVSIDDPDNAALAFDLGLIIIGESREFPRGFNWGSERRRETLNQTLESEYGVLTVGSNLFQRTRFSCSLKATTATERIQIDRFLTALERERHGLFLIPEPLEEEAFYGRLYTDHVLRRTSPEITEFSGLEFVEDSAGRSVFAGFDFPELDTAGALLTEDGMVITTESGDPITVE